MNLNNGHTLKSFAEQRAFSFNLSFSVQNTTGSSSVSVSGDNGRFNFFSFNSGRVLDGNGRFVYSYSPDQELSISGNFRSGFFGYYINDTPIDLSLNLCPSTFGFDNFVVSTTGAPVVFSVDLFGETLPSYEISFPGHIPLTGNSITGFIRNTSPLPYQSLKVFSGLSSIINSDYQINASLNGARIKPGNSGQFVLSSSAGETSFSTDRFKNAIPLSGDLYFDTNFGKISQFSVLNFKASPVFFLDFQELENSTLGETGSFWSFNLQRQACSGTRFEFFLDDDRWIDPYFSFSNVLSVKTGYNNYGFTGGTVPFNSANGGRYICTGFVSGAGCSGDDVFNTRFDIFHTHLSGLYQNRFRYSISGIEEKFLYTGFLEEGI
jgi:hypothetical protein